MADGLEGREMRLRTSHATDELQPNMPQTLPTCMYRINTLGHALAANVQCWTQLKIS